MFLDPPYGSGLLPPALASLAGQAGSRPGARIVAEVADPRAPRRRPRADRLEDERAYGAARLIFLRQEPAPG